MKKKLKRFWREWGITKEEFEMLIVAIGVVFSPFILRIIIYIF